MDALAPATASSLTSFVMRAASTDLTDDESYFIIMVDDRIALPYSTAAPHAQKLERLIADASRIRLSKQPAETLRSRSGRLADAMAVLEPGFIETEYGKSPADMVRLEGR